MAHTKTFKIGEYCKGGIITVEITGKVIIIIGKEWDHSTGSRRSSDQSNAKEFTRGTTDTSDPQADRKIIEFLTNLTTSYHTEIIMGWIRKKVKLQTSLFW